MNSSLKVLIIYKHQSWHKLEFPMNISCFLSSAFIKLYIAPQWIVCNCKSFSHDFIKHKYGGCESRANQSFHIIILLQLCLNLVLWSLNCGRGLKLINIFLWLPPSLVQLKPVEVTNIMQMYKGLKPLKRHIHL